MSFGLAGLVRLFLLVSLGLSALGTQTLAFELPKGDVLLKDIRATVPVPELTESERRLTVNQVGLVFDQIYAHTDVKRIHYNNPNLDPFKRTLAIDSLTAFETLNEISNITMELRDLHQSFKWPLPYSCLRTFVPIELGLASFVPFDRRVVVKGNSSDMIASAKLRSQFEKLLSEIPVGSIINKVNGEEVWSALGRAATFGGGANEDAFLTEGLLALTMVSQRMRSLPDTDALELTYLPPGMSQVEKTVVLPFLVRSSQSCRMMEPNANNFGFQKPKPVWLRQHPHADDLREFHWRNEISIHERIDDLKTSMEPTIKFGSFKGPSGRLGYLRIDGFSPDQDIEVAQDQIEKIVRAFQKGTQGLVIDVRGNPGGSYGDYLTQFFSPIPVVSQTEELRATEINIKILEKMSSSGIDVWAKMALQAVRNGYNDHRRYSDRVVVNEGDYLNEKGRIYFHPVIVLADPNCYSYCDYFTTSMQDHQAAEIWIENGAHTGGGGAIVSSYEGFSRTLPDDLKALPRGQDIGIAISTGYRTGLKENVSIETWGADADRTYHSTFDDIKQADVNLFEALGLRLKELSAAPLN